MKAVVVTAAGGPEMLDVRQVGEPELPAGHVLLDVAWGACNWGDIQKRRGVYPDPVRYPTILGGEVSGHVSKLGAGVTGVAVGQAVAAITGPDMLRGFAERVAVPQEFLIPLPASLGLRASAAYPVASLTAWHLLNTPAEVLRGDTILIHAIGGAVGLAVTQLARASGVRVIGTVGTAAKGQRARDFGAERVIARDVEDFVEVTMQVTGGRGVDLVIDSLGADILRRSFDALRPFGRVINIGEAAGEPDFAIRKKLYERSTSLAGFEVLDAKPGSDRWRVSVAAIAGHIADGTLQLPIAGEFDIDNIKDAHAFLEDRMASGKVLI
jgi:NADPH2:quinone reductase